MNVSWFYKRLRNLKIRFISLKAIKCSPPPLVRFSTLQGEVWKYSSSIKYTCSRGLILLLTFSLELSKVDKKLKLFSGFWMSHGLDWKQSFCSDDGTWNPNPANFQCKRKIKYFKFF